MTPAGRPAYDPNDLDPVDEEARKCDDASEGIDWDEIIATTQEDWEAGRFSFDSDDYPTDEEAMAAMDRMIDSILEEAVIEAKAARTLDASCK